MLEQELDHLRLALGGRPDQGGLAGKLLARIHLRPEASHDQAAPGQGALVDLPDIHGVTPLLAAAGATRALVTADDHTITEQETTETVRLLQEAGADVNATTHDGVAPPAGAPTQGGETALHTAALRGWNERVKLLVGYGARLDAEAVQAKLTPIDFAMGRFQPGFPETKPVPHPDTAALLKQQGTKEEHPNLPPWPGVPTPNITAQVPN